ncbi:MAG: sulfate adenylyltransferase subunit CysN [Bacteroidales bacterium]|nr:sulfate adenylyltransferase subunit CysN [Bacteroidales bacterium]
METTNLNIKEFLDRDEQKDLLRFLTAGSVDDGKSTLIGRLLFDSKKIYEDQLDALERDSKRVGNAGEHIDYALLLDGLKAEREQGITIDVAYRYFSTNNRKFIIADTPGHEQYTRNMITGGSTANAAVILVDARTGVITQTRRHTYLISLLGIKHLVLAVNKMDLVDFDENVFNKIVSDFNAFVADLNIPDVYCIPLSALEGDNVVAKSDRTPWYTGKCLLDYLETVPIDLDRNYNDFRYPVQYVLRPNLDFRGFCGKVASGVVRRGDEVMALPSRKTSHVKSIVTYEGEIEEAFPPMCVTITLEDEIDISRGEMIVKPDNLPTESRNFEAMLVWMDEEPMDVSKQFFIKQTTNTTRARIDNIKYRVDVNTMERSNVELLKLNEIGRVVFTTGKELFFDPYHTNKQTGAFILIDPITNNTSAVGMIIGKVDAGELVGDDAIATIDLSALGIDESHRPAIEKVCEQLKRQGLTIKIK